MEPYNDLAKIELENKRFGGTDKDTAESGILFALPDRFDFFGYWSFAFEDSFMNEEKLERLYKRWKKRIGQKVFWTALSERGNIIEENGKKWAYIKLTSLIAGGSPDSDARSVHADGAGSFGVEQ